MALEFRISTGSSVPMYRQIADQVRRAVARGKLAAGECLPSVRSLAEQLVINPNTVARAYSELAKDRLVERQKGRGMFVTGRKIQKIYTRSERLRRIEQPLEGLVSEAICLGCPASEVHEALDRKLKLWGVVEPSTEGKGA